MVFIYCDYNLESLISKKYIEKNLLKPHDLSLSNISCAFNIQVLYSQVKSYSMKISGNIYIVIDSSLPNHQQKIMFFHELCHSLFHSGNQLSLTQQFYELQEFQANNFSLYAAMPYFMLKNYDLSKPNVIHELSEDFNLSTDLVLLRLEQVRIRIAV